MILLHSHALASAQQIFFRRLFNEFAARNEGARAGDLIADLLFVPKIGKKENLSAGYDAEAVRSRETRKISEMRHERRDNRITAVLFQNSPQRTDSLSIIEHQRQGFRYDSSVLLS